ncbi:MAG TPA: transposase [Syntrophobacteraceae bacterium]|nr:transposase [Syntrophobacteraceae bacterium]
MSRLLRIEFPGAWYHVMNRGRRRDRVYDDDADYLGFVVLLRETASLWDIRIGAFCLMDNHYHLLIHTPLGNLSRCMRHINGVYTQRFNRAHGHDGQLFRGRFKAIVVDGDSYLLQLVRYIHRNPVRAGITDRPDLYRWSSHLGYLSTAREWDWLYKGFFLSILSPRKRGQKAAYRRYIGEEDREEITQIFSGRKWPPILGDEDSISHLKARFFEQKTNPQVPDSRSLAPEVRQIMQAVSSHYRINESELVKCRRGRFNEPRAVAIHLTRIMRKDSFADIGSIFGLKSYSAVGAALESMRKRLPSTKELSERCRHIQRTLATGQTEI